MCNRSRSNWDAVYAALVGECLESVVWLPIGADAPSVRDAIQRPSFSFSGGTSIRFALSKEIFLTWTQRFPHTLQIGSERNCTAFSLDRIQASGENPWAAIYGARLEAVELLTIDDVGEQVVAVCHLLQGNQSTHSLWICTGGPNYVGEGDDLWIGLDCEPPNIAALRRVSLVGR